MLRIAYSKIDTMEHMHRINFVILIFSNTLRERKFHS